MKRIKVRLFVSLCATGCVPKREYEVFDFPVYLGISPTPTEHYIRGLLSVSGTGVRVEYSYDD